jgi:hypothetical protein
MIDDEEPVDGPEPRDVRVDDEGRRYVVLRDKVPIDKNVAYFAFDREAQEEAARARYLNQMGALGVLEARAKADALKSACSKTQYEYALFISENPWAVANHQLAPKRKPWAILAFAGVLVLAVIAAAAVRPSPTPSIAVADANSQSPSTKQSDKESQKGGAGQ